MQVTQVAVARSYYGFLPEAVHRSGDIWMALADLTSIRAQWVSGVVITPACDLANDKTDTITFLPVISIREYLCRLSGYALVRPALIDLFSKAGVPDASVLLARGRLPQHDDIDVLERELASRSGGKADASKHARCLAGIQAVRQMVEGGDSSEALRACVGDAKMRETWQKLVRNAHSDDVHFLPPDNQRPEISAVPEPAVVLLRYPCTQLLSSMDSWQRGASEVPGPMKTMRLQHPYLVDLLTRFARLYVRVGSPDLTNEAVDYFVSALGGKR